MSAVLKIYISLYNTEGAPFPLRKEISFCVRKIRNIILSITLGNSKPGGSSSKLVRQNLYRAPRAQVH